jgi:hypothetical protein
MLPYRSGPPAAAKRPTPPFPSVLLYSYRPGKPRRLYLAFIRLRRAFHPLLTSDGALTRCANFLDGQTIGREEARHRPIFDCHRADRGRVSPAPPSTPLLLPLHGSPKSHLL